MAIIHQATLSPTKIELLTTWLPGRAWYPGDSAEGLERVSACRFDDPDGEVGIEVIMVRAGDGPVVHVPLTYRAEALADAEHWLVGTIEHSVLGTRWVYDAVGDPVYLAALTAVIRTGGAEAEEVVESESGPQPRTSDMHVRGSGDAKQAGPFGELVRIEDGDPAVVVSDAGRLSIRRVLSDLPVEDRLRLTGTWTGQERPVQLAALV